MLGNLGRGVLGFVILTVAYFLVSTLVFFFLYFVRQLYSLPSWLQYPEVIAISAMAGAAGVAAGGQLLEWMLKDYPQRPVMIGFGIVMVALIALNIFSQVNYPADDILSEFISPLSRTLAALGFAAAIAWNDS
jgi:hypothetical protein